jgi:hypothetical protein
MPIQNVNRVKEITFSPSARGNTKRTRSTTPLKTPFRHLTQFPLNNPLYLLQITIESVTANGSMSASVLYCLDSRGHGLHLYFFRFNGPIHAGAPCKKKIKFLVASHCRPLLARCWSRHRCLPSAPGARATRRDDQTPLRDRANAVTLICREAVEQPHAAGALKPILATVARWV